MCEYSKVVYHPLFLGASCDCAGFPRPHRLALPGCTVGNWTPNPWLLSQISNSPKYPASPVCYYRTKLMCVEVCNISVHWTAKHKTVQATFCLGEHYFKNAPFAIRAVTSQSTNHTHTQKCTSTNMIIYHSLNCRIASGKRFSEMLLLLRDKCITVLGVQNLYKGC